MTGGREALLQARPLTVRLREEAAEWDDGEPIPALLLEAAEALEWMAAKVAIQWWEETRHAPKEPWE